MHSHSIPDPLAAPLDAVAKQDEIAAQKLAMKFSFWIGLSMFFGKSVAYAITGSAAILSDAAESVVHVAAVAFAAYSLWYSFRPPDPDHPYGHDKIHFFSAGFEGGMIILAALFIVATSLDKLLHGFAPSNLGWGTAIVAAAAVLNGFLGGYLVWTGRKGRSLILIANGQHVLTDCYTSIGVIVGLVLVMLTGWTPFDPICAILIALNILWTGAKLIRQAIGGLMDEVDPAVGEKVVKLLDQRTREAGIAYHGLRYRRAGDKLWIELHLIFDGALPLGEAHAIATRIENEIEQTFPGGVEVLSHLEDSQNHDALHPSGHFERFPQ